MNIFKKIFGSKSVNVNTENTQEVASSVEETPSTFFQDLFVENQKPMENSTVTKPVSRLNEFLSIEYSSIGFADGYQHHNAELLDHKISILKAEFCQIVDEAIDNHRQDIFQLHNQLIETRGLSDRLTEQVELRITEVKGLISKLEQEKQSSIMELGLVMKPVFQYKEGFLRGCKDWQEAKLLAQSTGLF